MTTRDQTWKIANEILTPRQLEALHLHDQGLSYRTIALHLGISQTRARTLVERAAQKLELKLREHETAA